MGGRGAGSGRAGGINPRNIVSVTSLISGREGKAREVDATLSVLRDIRDRYGVDMNDVQLATLKGKDSRVMAYYDADGNLAVNQTYFDSAKMDAAYDRCVSNGFHPSRGNKTGLEAVVAHEAGHRLTDSQQSIFGIDGTSDRIVEAAAKRMGYKNANSFRSKISGYAKESNAEAVAEAFADVYCNGSKASRESKAVVTELNKLYKRR